MADMWFTVLGPVRFWRCGVEVDLGAPQQRTLLALLLVRAGHPVGLTEIVDVLWGDDPPPSAVNTVHRGIGMLRRALEPGLAAREPGRWLVRAAGGYLLDLNADTVDLLRFRMLLARARSAAEPRSAVRAFAQALDLWQGPAASNVPPEVRGRPVFTAVDRHYEAAAREAADVALATGEPAPLMRAIEQAAAQAGLDESLQARLILMLAATGRQAAALRLYEKVRTRLTEELGIDPGAELAAARDRVLRPSGPPGCARCLPAATGSWAPVRRIPTTTC
jgi:DNA-binding SARP family transcriptional activator